MVREHVNDMEHLSGDWKGAKSKSHIWGRGAPSRQRERQRQEGPWGIRGTAKRPERQRKNKSESPLSFSKKSMVKFIFILRTIFIKSKRNSLLNFCCSVPQFLIHKIGMIVSHRVVVRTK